MAVEQHASVLASEGMVSWSHDRNTEGLCSSGDLILLYNTAISFFFFIQYKMITHNGRNDLCRSGGKQQLLNKAVPIVERFHQSPLLPGTLKTNRETETTLLLVVVYIYIYKRRDKQMI